MCLQASTLNMYLCMYVCIYVMTSYVIGFFSDVIYVIIIIMFLLTYKDYTFHDAFLSVLPQGCLRPIYLFMSHRAHTLTPVRTCTLPSRTTKATSASDTKKTTDLHSHKFQCHSQFHGFRSTRRTSR